MTPEERAQQVIDEMDKHYYPAEPIERYTVISMRDIIAAAIRETRAEAPRFIPISERLPEVGTRALLTSDGMIEAIVEITGEEQWESTFVTHWYPVPPRIP